MSERYFSATALGGRLYVHGLAADGLWDRARLALYPEDEVDVILRRDSTRRKVLTVNQLVAALEESAAGLPAISLFVHEALEHIVRATLEMEFRKIAKAT